ncbi:MAG: YeeE/YedE family protein [Inquilinus sp.]|uniref:YeeE/YedE family protein n=1 Tax=Inquilinus sp. TaxID=1932117 RepID=UPI003F2F72F9
MLICTEPFGIGGLANSGDHGSLLLLVAAGLLVEFGTRMGSGCTSGHGVAGLARLSPRSIVAVATSSPPASRPSPSCAGEACHDRRSPDRGRCGRRPDLRARTRGVRHDGPGPGRRIP